MVFHFRPSHRFGDRIEDFLDSDSDSESEYESDSDYSDFECNPGDNGMALAVVCKWNEKEFGRNSTSSMGIDYHWIVMETINVNKLEEMHERYEFYRRHCGGHVSLEVVRWECLYGMELVGYWKTFWLKLVQRKWKRIMAEKKKIIEERKMPKSLIYREKHGKWPVHLDTMPTLRGMMA